MIICHPQKMIFLKTKQVGGTSFEIALSKFCGPDCVITPISTDDEETRAALGFRGSQNFANTTWPDGTQTQGHFNNHISAKNAHALIPAEIWNNYKIVSIVRDPFDAMVSQFYWIKRLHPNEMDFGKFTYIHRRYLMENNDIAPLDGPLSPDVFLRYEHLEEDITALGIDGLLETFKDIKCKSNLRASKSSTKEIYQQFPDAADIVARQCPDEIAKFGYASPLPPKARFTSSETPNKTDFIFTLSAGRSGTSWMSKFLGENLDTRSVHEPLGLDDFGTQMPEISTMRTFNDVGMERSVRDFWNRKLSSLNAPYAESNHTLGKCGLIEALAESDMADRTTIVVLRRDLVKQCVSYINRNDFSNIGLVWQFYLSPQYRNNIVKGTPFMQLGPVGYAIWYCFEMEARYAYYLMKYADRLNFVEVKLEEITKPDGAREFLRSLGQDSDPILPEKANANKIQSQPALEEEVRTFMDRQEFDAYALAAGYLKAERDLSKPPFVFAA